MLPRSSHRASIGARNADRPDVSVIITAYNVGRFIRQAIFSALDQTLRGIEVIVVDDGSTDDTAAEIARARDPRLRIIRQSNQGASQARNAGLEAARAPLVAFLDGDDYWRPEKLEKQARFMAVHPEIDLSFVLCTVVDEDGAVLVVPSPGPTRPLSFYDLLVENYIRNGSTVVVRREALLEQGGFDPSFPACNDYEAWLRVAASREHNVECLPEVLTFYRRREGQISADWRRMRDAFQALLEKMERIAPQQTRDARAGAVQNMYRYLAILAYKNGEVATSASLLCASLRSSPYGFVTDSRSLLIAAAVANRALLGAERYRTVERWAARFWNRGSTSDPAQSRAHPHPLPQRPLVGDPDGKVPASASAHAPNVSPLALPAPLGRLNCRDSLHNPEH